MSTTSVKDNSTAARYEISVDDAAAGHLEYHLYGQEIALLHTEVDPAFSGRGLGGILVRGTLDDIRDRGLRMLPYCAFVRSFVAKNQEYLPLVSPEDRDRFDL